MLTLSSVYLIDAEFENLEKPFDSNFVRVVSFWLSTKIGYTDESVTEY